MVQDYTNAARFAEMTNDKLDVFYADADDSPGVTGTFYQLCILFWTHNYAGVTVPVGNFQYQYTLHRSDYPLNADTFDNTVF